MAGRTAPASRAAVPLQLEGDFVSRRGHAGPQRGLLEAQVGCRHAHARPALPGVASPRVDADPVLPLDEPPGPSPVRCYRHDMRKGAIRPDLGTPVPAGLAGGLEGDGSPG